jgi:MFS family permease
MLVLSAVAFGLTEAALAFFDNFALASALLFLSGMAMVTFTTVANTALQTAVPDVLRGRVMSVYTTVFIGTTPIVSPLIGAATQAWGVNIPLVVGGVAAVLAALVSWWWRPWQSHPNV